jgi:uncharacterized protein (TIGR00255 family)
LEIAVRAALTKEIDRGNVNLTLRLTRLEAKSNLTLDPAALQAVLNAILQVEQLATNAGVALLPVKATDLLAQRGVASSNGPEEDSPDLLPALMTDIVPLLADFNAMRANEGAALARVIMVQLDSIGALVAAATGALAARRVAAATALRDAVERVMTAAKVDPMRLEQELALIAVKSDVTEELDRLAAHVIAARELLNSNSPVGRKLDFLMQEFNREANTLCSKAQFLELTRIGLDLKTLIDQMREQVQNVE